MHRKNLYYFENRTDQGIDDVPNNSLIQLRDDGTGKTIYFTLLTKTGISPATTIDDVLSDPTMHKILGDTTILTYNYPNNSIKFYIP
jgi:hypothetical protein